MSSSPPPEDVPPRRHVDPSREAVEVLAGLPDDGAVVMLNLLRFRERADYPPDHPDPPCTGREAYDRYGRLAVGHVRAVGGQPVFHGLPELAVIGPEGEWDEVLLVRYPSRAAFLRMLADPDYRAVTVHRTAALADSRLVALRPG